MTVNSDVAVRVGDPEREHVATHLGRAFAQGYLSMDEYETRLARAFEAQTAGVLDLLIGDLPVERISRRDPRRRAARRTAVRLGVRIHLACYLAVSLVMIGIWLVTATAAGQWYFWPIWPILGWGIGVVSHGIGVHTAVCNASIRPASIAVHSAR